MCIRSSKPRRRHLCTTFNASKSRSRRLLELCKWPSCRDFRDGWRWKGLWKEQSAGSAPHFCLVLIGYALYRAKRISPPLPRSRLPQTHSNVEPITTTINYHRLYHRHLTAGQANHLPEQNMMSGDLITSRSLCTSKGLGSAKLCVFQHPSSFRRMSKLPIRAVADCQKELGRL